MKLSKGFPAGLREGVSLKDYTTFGIGGSARYFIEAKSISHLKEALEWARKRKIKIFILGAGSNLLVSDEGVDGLVMRLGGGYFSRIRCLKEKGIEAGAGVALMRLVRWAQKHLLSGLEFLAGIPGSVGGAVVMNAGAWGKDISSLVRSVKIMDYRGNISVLNRQQIKFGYRESSLQNFIVLSVIFEGLSRTRGSLINEKINRYLQKKRQTQELRFASCGCVFKNPDNESAGRLIEEAGLKGMTIGKAAISTGHANFIVNLGGARCGDVLKLMSCVRRQVRKRFHINLQPEVIIW